MKMRHGCVAVTNLSSLQLSLACCPPSRVGDVEATRAPSRPRRRQASAKGDECESSSPYPVAGLPPLGGLRRERSQGHRRKFARRRSNRWQSVARPGIGQICRGQRERLRSRPGVGLRSRPVARRLYTRDGPERAMTSGPATAAQVCHCILEQRTRAQARGRLRAHVQAQKLRRRPTVGAQLLFWM